MTTAALLHQSRTPSRRESLPALSVATTESPVDQRLRRWRNANLVGALAAVMATNYAELLNTAWQQQSQAATALLTAFAGGATVVKFGTEHMPARLQRAMPVVSDENKMNLLVAHRSSLENELNDMVLAATYAG